MFHALAPFLALGLPAALPAPLPTFPSQGLRATSSVTGSADAPEASVSLPTGLAAVGGSVVLFVADGARWQEMFLGSDERLLPRPEEGEPGHVSARTLFPNLYRLIDRNGVALGGPGCGNTVVASGPSFVSLPGYFELMSGRWGSPCQSNSCARAGSPSLLDELRSQSGAASSVALFASWKPIELTIQAPALTPVSAGRNHHVNLGSAAESSNLSSTLQAAIAAAAFPGDEDYRPDEFTAGAALAYQELVHPRLLFVGLGDTDEYAHRGDYGGYLSALRRADDTIGALADTLERSGEGGQGATLLVTADHGRADNFRDHGGNFPESARTFLFALGPRVAARGIVCPGRPLRLADIGATARALVGLRPLEGERTGRAIEEVVGGGSNTP